MGRGICSNIMRTGASSIQLAVDNSSNAAIKYCMEVDQQWTGAAIARMLVPLQSVKEWSASPLAVAQPLLRDSTGSICLIVHIIAHTLLITLGCGCRYFQ